MKITCTRRIQFCAGHRLVGHESKCAHLHGHNYVALVEAEAHGLDRVGRVIDFSVLKERVGGWIEREWDHGMILNLTDHAGRDAVRSFEAGVRECEHRPCEQKLFLMPYNPTAENMARYLGEEIAPMVLGDTGVRVVRVELWETENCKAEWSVP